ncbi:hypothetical protein [Streptomyces sp. NPDC056049]|uniref:Rv1733c family protein n=1 Tax=Streptomyces sp. NPDC056049 TaxID=3345693 RepID=UPI0035E12C69
MRAISGLWRWRRNPLRRTTDLVEAWVALAAAVLLCVGAPLAGWTAGSSAQASLQRAVRAQQQGRVETTARVLRPAPPALSAEARTSEQRFRRAVVARWTAPDGSPRTGTVTTSRGSDAPGDAFRLWTDRDGRAVPAPLARDTARAHAWVAGLTAAVLAGLGVELVRRLVMRRLRFRRYARLDRAWASVGPDWGRTGTGS